MPITTNAQENGGRAAFDAASRASDPGPDWAFVMLVTALAVLGLFLLVAIGYLYRRERGLHWRFQNPDPDHHTH